MKMPPLPKPVIHGTSGKLYIKESPKGEPMYSYKLSNLEVVADNTKWAAIIDNDVIHEYDVMNDLLIRGVGSNKWGVRRYKIKDGVRRNIVVRDIDTEHDFYESCHSGYLRYEDCAGINTGAQFIQHRLSGNRSDPDWKNQRAIVVVNCQAREVGKLSGAGRAGFGLSIKDCGPNSTVTVMGYWSRTVKQSRVAKRSDGTWADSFGAICVEYCGGLDLSDFHVEHKNPDRDVVQLFDYANKAATKTGPRVIKVRRGEIQRGGNLAVRVGDGDSIDIKPIQGDGYIKVMVRDSKGVWRHDVKNSKPLTEGFTWSK